MQQAIIHKVFEEKADLFAGHIAIREALREITYKDLNQCANRVAHRLLHLGYENGAMVGVLLDAGIELVQSMLGVFKSGNIYIPLDINLPDRRFSEIFRITPCRIIITSKKYEPALSALLLRLGVEIVEIIILDAEPLAAFSDSNPDILIKSDDGLYIIYTSGSTGEGKAILGCQKGLSHFIHWELEEFAITSAFKVSLLSQLTFDASFRDILIPLCAGGTLYIPPAEIKSDIVWLINWITESGISLIHCVPSLFRLILRELQVRTGESGYFPSLRFIIMAGESLYSKDVKSWYETVGGHAEIVNLYGTSETTLAKTFHRIKELPPDAAEIIHVGKPIKDTFVIIVNNRELCSVGEIGEIYIKTPYMTLGYYNNSQLNEVSFVQNPLISDRKDIVHKTGDYGKYLKDRSIQYYGRLDDQVKVNGIRVELNEIKLAVMEIPEVREVEVLSQKNDEQEVKLICYYTGDIEDDELRAALKEQLSTQLMPAWFIRLREFPLNINGKVDRKKLPQPDVLEMNRQHYEAPAGATERALELIWSEVLGLQQISRNISFFKAGGNSLRSMQVISRIFHDFNVAVKINDVFLHPTISQLAAVIDGISAASLAAITPLPESEYYEASHGQKRLWLLNQMNGSMTAYNVFSTYLLDGVLDVHALKRAFDSLCQRHESLRTTFHFIKDELMQRVAPYVMDTCSFETADMCGHTDCYEKAQEWCRMQCDVVFRLSEGPLFKVSLLKIEQEKHILVLNIHHIISDDWSLKVLTEEVFALYETYRKGLQAPLLPLLVQYRDFTAWHNQLLKNEQLSAARQYWSNQFSGQVPVLKMPLDFTRPAFKTYVGAVEEVVLDKAISGALRDLARIENVTTFMVLLSAVNVLLHKYSGDTDIIIGVPFTGRPYTNLENQIGFYVNVLPMRARFSSNIRFTDLLTHVKEITVKAFEHQLYPFDVIVEDLQLPTDHSRSPLFDVMVAVQNSFVERVAYMAMSGISISNFDIGGAGSKCDLEFNFYEAPEEITLFIHYNTDLFSRSRIQLMKERFTQLLKQILLCPQGSLQEIIAQANLVINQSASLDLQLNISI